MSDKTTREEIADLAEAVRELRDREIAGELARLRADLRAGAGHCCGWHHPVYPFTWTTGGTAITCGGTPGITSVNSVAASSALTAVN